MLIQLDIIMELDDNFFPHKEGMPLELWRKGCLKKLARFKRGFTLQRTVNEGDRLFTTKQPNCIVPYIEEWPSIVRNAHFVDGFHLSIDDTMAKIEERKWLIGSNIQGIPKPFIDEMVETCGGCKFGDQSTDTSGEGRYFRQYTEHHKIPVAEQEEFMNNLKATYSVCLKPIHKYSRVLPNASTVFIYVCHRGTRFSGIKPEYDLHTDKQKQCSIAKHVGCKFAVKVICPNDTEQDIEIFVNTNHTGHEPGSKGDVFFLPLHQSAIDNCAEMLSNMNEIQLAVSHSERCENILRKKVPLHVQRTYCFFLDHKEASNLSYRLQMQERCGEDDYNVVKDMLCRWMEEEKVIFFQSYNPMDADAMKRPFVLVIQTKEMLERAKEITPESAWVLDSTFKTNHWGMPLFGAMCPNKAGLSMPVFFMICSNDNESGQVGTALYLTLKAVFGNMGSIRPNAIIIDKDKTKRIVVLKVIKEDRFCWKDEQIGGIQTKY